MRLLACAFFHAALLTTASAQTVGVSVSAMDTFRALLADSIGSAADQAGLTLQTANADGDGVRQLADIKTMIDAGVSGLVVLGVNTEVEEAAAKLSRARNVPLVFVNHEPPHSILGDKVGYVGSDEKQSGTIQTQEVCRLLAGKGSAVVLIGELNHPAAKMRTRDIHDVLATPECKGIEILEEQGANWSREQAADITRVWLEGGLRPDAVIANNDDMALGAADAIKAASAGKIFVAGIDATKDAVAALQSGTMAVTVLQDAAGQGHGAVSMVQSLMKGEVIEPIRYVPFQLVTPADVPALLAARGKN